jgi:bile acid:Na+ symporter, BASS family
MLLTYFVPALVVLMMTIVGTGLSAEQFKLITRNSATVLWSSLIGLLLLPAGALIIGHLLASGPEMAGALVLIAACPGGALSNYYCYLVKSNAALSVVLTGLSSLHAFITLPILLTLLLPHVLQTENLQLPFGLMIERLLFLLLLPILIGVFIRHRFPHFILRRTRSLRGLSILFLIALLVAVLFPQWHKAQAMIGEVLMLGSVFTGYAMLVGWGVGFGLRLKGGEKMVLPLEFAIHNLGIAAIIATTVLGRPEFLTFAGLFVVLQFLLISVGLVCFQVFIRRRNTIIEI